MKPEDLEHLAVPSDPDLHPDEERVAYVCTRPDLAEDAYHRTVRLWDGEEDRAFTHGPHDSTPRWSPDGEWLAFLRKGEADDATPQVAIMPAAGGEARVITDFTLGVSELVWSPAGHRLVVAATTWREDLAELDHEERNRRPKRITRLGYQVHPATVKHGRLTHLWVVDPFGDEDPRCLTPGDEFDEVMPTWSPDGREVCFLSERHERRGIEPKLRAWVVDVESLEVRSVVDSGFWFWAGFAPDGDLYVAGLEDAWDWPDVLRLFRVTEDGLVDLTGHLDRDVVQHGAAPPGPRFVEGGLVTAIEGRGVVEAVRLDADGEVTPLLDGSRQVTGLSAKGDTAVFVVSDVESPGDLVMVADGEERVLTSHSEGVREKVEFQPTSSFTFERDGAELDVWVVTPPGFADAEPSSVPVLLNIHGGPTAQYTWGFLDEFQVYASAGYLVVATNPRGSSGRGSDWCRAIVGAWKDRESVDILDLRAVVDATLERYQQADAERVGVMGGSYGGWATARVIAQDHRFTSAVVERGALSAPSFFGTSDIGQYFYEMFLGESWEESGPGGSYAAASPLFDAAEVTTPTLVLHSEMDFRCPIEQGEQYFAALQRAGVPSEFVRFPGEGHELSRSGTPKHRRERFEIILDWHNRHL